MDREERASENAEEEVEVVGLVGEEEEGLDPFTVTPCETTTSFLGGGGCQVFFADGFF